MLYVRGLVLLLQPVFCLVAGFTHAHWFFGNLFEVLVKVPHRLAAAEASTKLSRSPFGAGGARAGTTFLSPRLTHPRPNPKLFFGAHSLSEDERRPLLSRWYQVHAFRLTASAVALAAIHHARTIRLRNR